MCQAPKWIANGTYGPGEIDLIRNEKTRGRWRSGLPGSTLRGAINVIDTSTASPAGKLRKLRITVPGGPTRGSFLAS